MKKIAVIGGGAAGLMAAGFAAYEGADVTLYEKNEKLGKKIFITGKGRCNVTNACDKDAFLRNIVRNPKFILSALYSFDSFDTIDFFENHGIKLKVERGNRVFPVSDKSSDIIKGLTRFVEENSVKINLYRQVDSLIIEDSKIIGIKVANERINYDAVVIATGGLSYKATGSTGDGYRWAYNNGIELVKPMPSLCPLIIKENVSNMQGLSLKNVKLTITKDNRLIYNDSGEMLFTRNGISGPLVLSASSQIDAENISGYMALIDLKPYIDEKELDSRVLREFQANPNKELLNVLSNLMPKSIIKEVINQSGLKDYLKINQLTRENRQSLVNTIKKLEFHIEALADINEAIITRGGISVKELNPKTMESKKIKGLYFAGEIIDVDALTGGFNLQIAFSTGRLAGKSSAID